MPTVGAAQPEFAGGERSTNSCGGMISGFGIGFPIGSEACGRKRVWLVGSVACVAGANLAVVKDGQRRYAQRVGMSMGCARWDNMVRISSV